MLFIGLLIGILIAKPEEAMIENNMKVLRAKNNITQEELAQKVGATRQTILAIEKNKYAPSLKLALEIAKVFETPINEVFFLKNEK